MKIALLPLDIKADDKKANISEVLSTVHKLHAGVDILVLPELFSTGLPMDIDAVAREAESMDGITMQTLQQAAREKMVAIAGSFLCRDNEGKFKNRAFFIDPDREGVIEFYDKRHLFVISPEHKMMSKGYSHAPIVKFRGWNIMMSICFDIRFPAWCRNTGLNYDMMLVPANWPDTRYYAWKHLLIARAIENAAVYVGVNRSGRDRFGAYSFLSSMAVDAKGRITGRSHGESPVIYADFDLDELREFRCHFPVHEAADNFDLLS